MPMLPLLLLLVTAQVPTVPGETTLVSFCKQLRASACQELRNVNPRLADAIEAGALKAARQLAAQRAAEEESSSKDEAKATEEEGRDERFKTRAKDKESHCGYQKWHREIDDEVIAWLRREDKATPAQFEKYLRELYNRPELRKRFPNGL